MNRVIEIQSCDSCPFFKPQPNHFLEDSFNAICTHPNLMDGNEEWVKRIGRSVDIPNFCPLDTVKDFAVDNY